MCGGQGLWEAGAAALWHQLPGAGRGSVAETPAQPLTPLQEQGCSRAPLPSDGSMWAGGAAAVLGRRRVKVISGSLVVFKHCCGERLFQPAAIPVPGGTAQWWLILHDARNCGCSSRLRVPQQRGSAIRTQGPGHGARALGCPQAVDSAVMPECPLAPWSRKSRVDVALRRSHPGAWERLQKEPAWGRGAGAGCVSCTPGLFLLL